MARQAWFEIEGLNEFKANLRNLPATLTGGATQIILDAAHEAAADIRAQYPTGPKRRRYPGGALKKGVHVVIAAIGPHGVAAQVRSSAPHAWLYEHGSSARHYMGHSRGAMPKPPTPVFIPTMIKHRRAMYLKLAALLRLQGLTVTEDL